MKFTSLFSMINGELVSIYPQRYFVILIHQDMKGKFKSLEIESLYDEETKEAIFDYDGEKFC
jgi:hypothetical protein